MQQNTNQTCMIKFLAVFCMDKWLPLKQDVLNPGLPKILRENADVVFLMKAQVTRKRVILHKLFFMNNA